MEFQLYTTTAKNLPLGNRNPRFVCLASNSQVDTQTKHDDSCFWLFSLESSESNELVVKYISLGSYKRLYHFRGFHVLSFSKFN